MNARTVKVTGRKFLKNEQKRKLLHDEFSLTTNINNIEELNKFIPQKKEKAAT